jgi:hemin uptake protein HemP
MSLNPAGFDVPFAPESTSGPARALSRTASRATDRETIDSRELLRGGRELAIRHGEHEYRLRLTQNDKLILTK